MLTLPDEGFAKSIKQHNVNTTIMSDWVESSVVFLDDPVTKSEIIDILREEYIYESQDFAAEQVEICWAEIERRSLCMGKSSPVVLDNLKVSKSEIINVGHMFCMMLSRSAYYQKWGMKFGRDFNEQGNLFEELTCCSLRGNGWITYKTGWSNEIKNRQKSANMSASKGLITRIANELNELLGGNFEHWLGDDTKEAGLDIVSCKPFTDGWPGIPTYFVQCASGANWPDKLKEPDIKHWAKMIDFSLDPQRAISIPFSLGRVEFKRRTNSYSGIIIDRYRVLSAGHKNTEWVPPDLSRLIQQWLSPRIKELNIIE